MRAQPALLERAVLNVLDNAAKWSPPGGTIRVRLRRDQVVDPGRARPGAGDRRGRPASGVRPLLPGGRRPGRCPARGWGWPSCSRSSPATAGSVQRRLAARAGARWSTSSCRPSPSTSRPRSLGEPGATAEPPAGSQTGSRKIGTGQPCRRSSSFGPDSGQAVAPRPAAAPASTTDAAPRPAAAPEPLRHLMADPVPAFNSGASPPACSGAEPLRRSRGPVGARRRRSRGRRTRPIAPGNHVAGP